MIVSFYRGRPILMTLFGCYYFAILLTRKKKLKFSNKKPAKKYDIATSHAITELLFPNFKSL